ncbi:hypothetical protein GPECTOR_91g567 [Gonium pectorale]|uniref:Peptidase M43 pregnancy-associated plasma-A domain-containing protein n=1 Tax=Gonium pectorale TaxID=33097 RepID=A0A150G0K1_GONPE|nr:hypothetical protein GPECTOR_91g567 [Gonium pectorale]|eukprot:KXZ43413.1 hypothetical protein GPECTOR_91g567 [Gonium pectorale]
MNVSCENQSQSNLIAAAAGSGPFVAVHDPATAHSNDVHRLYEQASAVAEIAYLLFAAAKPMAQAPGSPIRPLLPLLTPRVLRIYASAPGRCNSTLVSELNDIARSIKGDDALEHQNACHGALLQELGPVFGWMRENAERLRDASKVSSHADHPPWPLPFGPSVLPTLSAALAAGGPLGASAAAVEAACGLNASAFASATTRVSDALAGLQAKLGTLSRIRQHQNRRWASERGAHNPATVAAALASRIRSAQQQRRSLGEIPPNYVTQYPNDFKPAAPASLPQLLVPLVVHTFLYRNADGSLGPSGYDQLLPQVQDLVKYCNLMSAPTNIQFFIKEWRNDPVKFPHLVLPNRVEWVGCYSANETCFRNSTLMQTAVADFPRSINLFIVGDSSAIGGVAGSAFVPGSDMDPSAGYTFVSWDQVTHATKPEAYFDGPETLLHELFHHLGVSHPFGTRNEAGVSCDLDDYLDDTPLTQGPVSSLPFDSAAVAFCLDLFWSRDGGDWSNVFRRWSTALGIPEEDKNAWADSCPGAAGYDELGNYMTYNSPICYATLGHFTQAQVERAHYITSQMNPLLYAWAQYYALTAPPPSPPVAEPPAPAFSGWDKCKVTTGGCACKSSWQYDNQTYSYCGARSGSTNLMVCEVADPASCAACDSTEEQCLAKCAGTAPHCGLPGAPGSYQPYPPHPPSPPPMPPPPPPRQVPDDCKVTASGCPCRALWKLPGLGTFSYCGFRQNYTELPYFGRILCQVDPSCPEWSLELPLAPCKARSANYCGAGRPLGANGAHIVQPPLPSAPARSPPPRRRPPPPRRNSPPPARRGRPPPKHK